MDEKQFIEKLKKDGIFLRHHTRASSIVNIFKDYQLKAQFTEVEGEIPEDFQEIKSVYFSFVHGIKPRLQRNICDLYFTPDLISKFHYIIHPIKWHFGSTLTTKQYSNLSDYSNVTLEETYKMINYGDEYDENNEILICDDVSLSFLSCYFNSSSDIKWENSVFPITQLK